MADRERGVRWPDGKSVSIPIPFTPFVVQRTSYSNAGAPTAPRVTYTGSLGFGSSGLGPHVVFLRNGMTSEDTLGWGASGNVSTVLPSVTLNASIPDEYHIPLPWKAKVSSIEAGLASPGASGALTYTLTPEQISDYLTKSRLAVMDLFRQAPPTEPSGPVVPEISPNGELSPFARTLRSGHGTIGTPSEAPVRYLTRRQQEPVGEGMNDWRSSTVPVEPWGPTQAAASPPQEPGGLYGLLLDYLRNGGPIDRQ